MHGVGSMVFISEMDMRGSKEGEKEQQASCY